MEYSEDAWLYPSDVDEEDGFETWSRERSLFRIFGNSTTTSKEVSEQKSDKGEQKSDRGESSGLVSPDEGVVGGHEAEAARGHLFRKNGSIYMLTNTVTGKSYIGQTIQRVSKRMKQHAGGKQFGSSRGGKPSVIQRSIAKHGWDKFTWVLLESNIAHVKILDKRERHWIKVKCTLLPNGYNMSLGGQGENVFTPAMRKARSKAMRPWARSAKSRARKSELWKDESWREERCKERKVNQNKAENVQSRHDKWDAKRDKKLQSISDPKKRRKIINRARYGAKASVRSALKRGVEGRDVWAEFYARWGSDEAWVLWRKSGSCDPPRGSPSHCTRTQGKQKLSTST